MKKSVLATIMVATMLVSVFSCLIANADTNGEKTVFFNDFENGTELGICTFRDLDLATLPSVSYDTETGHDGSETKVLHVSEPSNVQPGSEDQWQYVRFVPLVTHLDLTKKYTVSMYVKGDISNLQIIGHTGVLHQYPHGEVLGTEWREITCTVGPTSYLGFQVVIQSKEEVCGRNFWIDDISITESATDSIIPVPHTEDQNTPILDNVTPIFHEDFEGEGTNNPQITSNLLSVAQDLFDVDNHAIKVTKEEQNTAFVTNTFINQADPDKTYTFVFRTLGDCGMVAIGNYKSANWSALPPNDKQNPENGFTGWAVTSPTWRWHVIKTTGQDAYSFFGQVQGDAALLGYQLYIDDIYVYADDYFDEAINKLNGIIPSPVPTLSSTYSPTVEPTGAVPTITPTATAPTPTAEPTATPSNEPNNPDTPDDDDNASTNTNKKTSNSDKKSGNPKTGDNSSLILWIAFAFISLAGVVVAGTMARRKAVRK